MPLSAFQPDNYAQLLHRKKQKIIGQFACLNAPQLEVFASPNAHFRMRIEFRVWHEGDDIFFVMFHPDQPKVPVRMDHFPIASQKINEVIQLLPATLKQSPLLCNRLFQIELLSTLSGELLLTLVYHKKLSDDWREAASTLAAQFNIDLIGRSKKQKLVVTKDYVIENLLVDGRHYHYRQDEGGFTQPNATVNQKMLEWALQQSRTLSGNLLELYCGNGNFTLVLAQQFDRVLATEVSKTSVRSALENLRMNQIDNVEIVRMSSEEFTQALNRERPFRRLRHLDLDDYHFSTVFVDPPRAGLDKQTEQLVRRFKNILYISCNPDTLKQNLLQLDATHKIEAMALFDQFPYTDHVECGVLLVRRQIGTTAKWVRRQIESSL